MSPSNRKRPPAKKASETSAKNSPAVKAKRRGLIAFCVIFVLLFVIVGVSVGIGSPSVPSDAVAIVEDLPDGTATITVDDLNKTIEQLGASSASGTIPKEGTPEYAQLKLSAFNNLLDLHWIQGEADVLGITVTGKQVGDELATISSQSFSCKPGEEPFKCDGFKKFMVKSKYSEADVNELVTARLLGQEIQTSLTKDAPKPTTEQMKNYYNTFREQFKVGASRDVRIILNKDKAQVEEAKAALEKDSSDASWKAVAKKYSTDPASKNAGGLREKTTDGVFETAMNTALFAAPLDTLEGPIKTDSGYYVFEVQKDTPESIQSFDTVKPQLEQQLAQQIASTSQQEFVDNYQQTWTARTYCASGYKNERCANADGQNDFQTPDEKKAADKAAALAAKGKAPVSADQVVWPKPPNTVAFPINPISAAGNQIVCYLASDTGATGAAGPTQGTAPPQRPHPAGAEISPTPAGQTAPTTATCGLPVTAASSGLSSTDQAAAAAAAAGAGGTTAGQ